jgi:hypothetical protein
MTADTQFILNEKRTQSVARSRKKRELYRLALAARDVGTAENYCKELFESINWNNERIPFHLTDAFSAAVVIAYARPFVQTKDTRSVGTLSSKWHKFSNPKAQKTHETMLRLRHDLFAHTDQTLSPMTIFPAGVMMKKVGRPAPRTSWQIAGRAIPPEVVLLDYRSTCTDLRERLEAAVSEAVEDLYGNMDLPHAPFLLRFDDGF